MKEVSEEEAVFVCVIEGEKPSQYYKGKADETIRLYRWYYYTDIDHSTGKKLTENGDIKVKGQVYKKYANKSDLCITECSNLLFGDWYSIDVEPRHVNKSNTVFSRANFDKVFAEAREHVEEWERRGGNTEKKRVHFSYPKIRWTEPKPPKKQSLIDKHLEKFDMPQ
jgi:hypothetical protein